MNEELEKNFLGEIKPLIDDYERYIDQEMPYSSVIEVNKYKQYADDEEGKILQSLDEELEKLVASRMAELLQAREKKIQEKREEIYTKTQEFVDATRGKIDEHIKEKKEQMKKKKKEAETYTKEMVDIRRKLTIIRQGIIKFKDIDEHIYTAMSESETEKIKDLTEKSRLYNQIANDYNSMKDEVRQLEEELDRFEKTYGGIDFTSEDGIEDIFKIVKEQQEKDLTNEQKNGEPTINSPRIHDTSDDIKVASIEEIRRKRNIFEEDIKRLRNEEIRKNQETVIDNQENGVDEEKRKKEEEERNKNKEKVEKEKQIRQKKEEVFNKKEKGYEDLLKNDVSYQALKENFMSSYKLSQLVKALNKKSLVEIYEMFVKQVIKDLENTEIEEGLTEEEKLQEKLDNEELKTTLSERLEMLKGREKEIKEREEQIKREQEQYNKREEQATKFFENIEKEYGGDILPRIYFKDKTDLIDKYTKGENTDLSSFNFLEYCEEQFETLEMNRDEPTVKAEEIIDYNDLKNKIEKIREKTIELGKLPPFMQECKEKLEKFLAKSEEGYKDLLPNLYYDRKKEDIKKKMLCIMKRFTYS